MKHLARLCILLSALLSSVVVAADKYWPAGKTTLDYRFSATDIDLLKELDSRVQKSGVKVFVPKKYPPQSFDCLRIRNKAKKMLRYICIATEITHSRISSAFFTVAVPPKETKPAPINMSVASIALPFEPTDETCPGECQYSHGVGESKEPCIIDNSLGDRACLHKGFAPDREHACEDAW